LENPKIDSESILKNLATNALPRTVSCYDQVSSTMDIARERLQTANLADLPLLVLAEEQTAGRGRLGRTWVAPAGSSLLFSLALRPNWLAPAHAPALIWWASVALCEGIADSLGIQPRLKWPNDVLIDVDAQWCKVAGILVELSSNEQGIERAIIGCGLNVSASPPANLPLRYPATHLQVAFGQQISRLTLLQSILRRLDHWYLRLQNGEKEQLFQTWQALLITLGQDIEVNVANKVLKGRAEAVDASGTLFLRDENNYLHSISSGDVASLGYEMNEKRGNE